jgi:hypothetical protein
VCDSCNDLLVDKEGKVYKDCLWNEWGLVCESHKMKGMEVYERYKKDDIIPKSHRLWTPMKMVFFGQEDNN